MLSGALKPEELKALPEPGANKMKSIKKARVFLIAL